MICELCDEYIDIDFGHVKVTEGYASEKYVHIFCGYNCLQRFFGWVDAK